MKKSYIDSDQESQNKVAYWKSASYITNEKDQYLASNYTLLPEEYSIFSEIDVSFFTQNNTAQDRFIALFLQYLKNCLLKIYTQYGVIRVLPKLSITLDEDEAIVLNWAYANFRIYFTFEKVIENSYYGIVAQDTEETVFTNVGKLTEINYSSIIDMILAYVIDNS